MKRFTLLLAVLVGLSVLATSHFSVADEGHDEVRICHVIKNFERPNGIVFYVGHIISVDDDAVEGHKNHGDVVLSEVPAQMINGGRCCSFSVLPNGDIVPGQID